MGIPGNKVRSRGTIEQHEHEDSLNARRVTIVGADGTPNVGTSPSNPLFVQLSDGSINIGTVNAELEVQLSHKDGEPDSGDVADSVRVGDGEDELAINEDGSTNARILDEEGAAFSESNPLTTSDNYEKILRAIDKSKWLELANFDKMETVVSVDRKNINLKYYEDGFLIGEAEAVYNSDLDWNFELFRYLLDDDGDQLLDDDDSPLLLE